VPDDEMEHVFNLGLGMLAVVPPDTALRAIDVVRAAGHDAWLVGEVVDGHGQVHVDRRAASRG
jgi:phosphoribosylformylglycinamidine cyclo-ligase